MYTKDFTGHKSSYRKSIEDIDKCLPDLGTASTFAFIIKAIHWSCSRISIRHRWFRVQIHAEAYLWSHWRIHGCLAGWRSFQEIWVCNIRVIGKFLDFAFHDRHNLLRRGNLNLVEIRPFRRDEWDRCIGREPKKRAWRWGMDIKSDKKVRQTDAAGVKAGISELVSLTSPTILTGGVNSIRD